MSKTRLEDVLETIGQNVSNLINAAGVDVKSLTGVGEVVANELASAIAQKGYYVGILPIGSPRNVTRHNVQDGRIQIAPNATLFAAVSNGTITFTGSASSGLAADVQGAVDTFGGLDTAIGQAHNVHVFVGSVLFDVIYQSKATDTTNTVSTSVAAAINAAAISGVTATASGNAVTVTGSPHLKCNVGTIGSVSKEVLRLRQMVQVSIYAPDPYIRYSVGDPILTGMGAADSRHLALSDNTDLFITYQGQRFIQKAQSSYSAFEWHITYDTEFSQMKTQAAVQIEGIEVVEQISARGFTTSITSYSG